MTRTKTLLIVTAAERHAANAAAVAVAGPYAAGTFDVPYTSGVGTKATHYVACWSMPDVQLAAFKKTMAAKMAGKTVQCVEKAGLAELSAQKLSPVKKVESAR